MQSCTKILIGFHHEKQQSKLTTQKYRIIFGLYDHIMIENDFFDGVERSYNHYHHLSNVEYSATKIKMRQQIVRFFAVQHEARFLITKRNIISVTWSGFMYMVVIHDILIQEAGYHMLLSKTDTSNQVAILTASCNMNFCDASTDDCIMMNNELFLNFFCSVQTSTLV